MKTLNLGILGMGTVASGLINIIEMNNTKLTGILGKEIKINKILVKNIEKKRNVNIQKDIYTVDPYEVINDEDVQILVELIGGINPAYEYIKAALNNKKHVVTANKALIATHGEELEELAKKNGVRLMYEASVGGGIPIINTMTESLIANEFDEIVGIINGTTNYILTQMTEKGLEFDQAVKEAQDLGFAEADPSSDVDGDDAAFKLAILSTIAFGQRIYMKDISKEGISKISKEDINYAKELGYNIKLLATALKNKDEIELKVHPAFIHAGHPLSTVKNEFNAVLLKGNAVGEIMLYGRGAGSLPTGSAVLGDIITIAKNIDTIAADFESVNKKKYKIVNKALNRYYVRLEVVDKPGVLGSIANIFGKNNISLASVVQRQKNGNHTAPLVFITHEVERNNIDAALKEIADYEGVTEIASIIMVGNFK
nr:homoserine dehydrogenase [Sedimentibacter sp.]